MAAPGMMNNLAKHFCFRFVKLISCREAQCTQMRHVHGAIWEGLPPVKDPDSFDDGEGKRNISRLPTHLRNRMDHVHASTGVIDPEYGRKTRFADNSGHLFARYGKSSGIDPSMLWISQGELKEVMEEREEFEPSLADMLEELHMKKAEEERERLELEQRVEEQMARMPEYIAKFKAKLYKQQQKEQKESDERRQLKEEIRDYFGYDLDPKDQRVLQMQEAKAEEELRLKKKKKKEEKQAQMLAQLQALAAETSQPTKGKSDQKSKPEIAKEGS